MSKFPSRRIGMPAAAIAILIASVARPCGAQSSPLANGTARLQWDQPAASETELDTFRYVLYVDDTRIELVASCAGASSSTTFGCDAALPRLTVGEHLLQLAAFVGGQTDLESSRSAPLRVTVPPTEPLLQAVPVVTSDGVSLRLDTIVVTPDVVNGLAVTSDGVLLIAERSGALSVRRNGVTTRDASALPDVAVDGGGFLAVASAPDFPRSHAVYVAYAARSDDSTWVARLARVRESAGTFGDRIVLFETPLAKPIRNAALRFAADATLYFGVDETIVRLNADGTTPVGQPGMTPTVATGFASVSGLDWRPAAGSLWAVDSLTNASGQLVNVAANATAKANTALVRLSVAPSAMTFYEHDNIAPFQGNGFVASDEGQMLLRVRFDRNDPAVVTAIEPLLARQIGGIRAIAVSPDGALLLGTTQSVLRLAVTSR